MWLLAPRGCVKESSRSVVVESAGNFLIYVSSHRLISPCEQNFLICWVTPSDQASEWTALLLRGCVVNPFIQWRNQGRGPGGPGHPLFLDQTRDPKDRKNVFWRPPPLPSKGLDDLNPPLSQGLDLALLFTTQTLTIRRLCCHTLQSWQGRGRGA